MFLSCSTRYHISTEFNYFSNSVLIGLQKSRKPMTPIFFCSRKRLNYHKVVLMPTCIIHGSIWSLIHIKTEIQSCQTSVLLITLVDEKLLMSLSGHVYTYDLILGRIITPSCSANNVSHMKRSLRKFLIP